MELSLFLAKLIGFYMLIIALIMVWRKDQFDNVIKGIVGSKEVLAFSGIVSLIAGLAIVIGHPVWKLSWQLVITLIGCVAIIQGIIRLAFVEEVQKSMLPFIQKKHWVIFSILVVLGLFLIYNGFVR